MPATLIDKDLHIVEQICLEKSQRLPCCLQHRWHPKQETILSWSLVTSGMAMVERYICNPDVASRHHTPTDLIHKDLQERIHTHVFSCVFFLFFGGGVAPPVLPSDIVTSRNKGALPPWYFLPGFYV